MFWAVMLVSLVASAGNQTIPSFREAKRLAAPLYTETFYCGCKLAKTEQGFVSSSCGYVPRRGNERSRRVEWEHVVPAKRIGALFPEYRDGHERCVNRKGRRYRGRRCAEKVNLRYRKALADLYNLRPVVGELNEVRAALPVGVVSGEPREYGACDFETGGGVVEPRERIRGDVARTYLYMDLAYGRFLTGQERALMLAWSKADPVDEAECAWARRVADLQKNTNPVLVAACAQLPPPRQHP